MICVLAEHSHGRLHPASLEAIAAAQSFDEAIVVAVAGHDAGPVALEAAQTDVAEVVALEHERLANYTPDAMVAALADFLRTLAPSLVCCAHTYQARDFAPRLAARLGRPLVTDCVGIAASDGARMFSRPMFQGKVLADVVLAGPPPHFVSFQIGAFQKSAVRAGATPAPVRTVAAAIDPGGIRQRAEAPFREARQAIDLSQADRVVAVGRGIKEDRHIALARELAEALGAELAASRPVCDAGWLPMDRQIGSSGQAVSPRLYVALGISGAIQHVVGMKGARTVVAVNTDPDAPIFEIADYGVVGDLFEIVPAMIAALRDA